MRFISSIFTSLLAPIDRRHFCACVKRHKADAYAKGFGSWQHLVTLVYAQVSGADSLRAIETGFNAQRHHHYHLNCAPVARSTLADANRRRPSEVFMEVFASLVPQLGRKVRSEAKQVMRLLDSTPVPLPRLLDCGASNGRIHGLKLHVVYDPDLACPLDGAVTPANVNDITPARALALEAGITYVFDKGYCHFGWWTSIHEANSVFVTRPKTNMRWCIEQELPLHEATGDGFQVLKDERVRLASKGDSRLMIPLRRITVQRDNGDVFTLVSNDMQRSALEIAACYKTRWQIELLFRWIKQNLNIKKFIATNKNAIILQIIAALIAFILLHIARKYAPDALTPSRFAQLVATFLHSRRNIATIQKPPPINPNKPKPQNTNQLTLPFT